MNGKSSPHPLDPLNTQEIAKAVQIIRRDSGMDETGWFETITLQEPRLPFPAPEESNKKYPRRAYVCCYEPSSNRTLNGIVNLDDDQIEPGNM